MIKRKLNIYFTVIILVSVLITGVISSKIVSDSYKNQIENELRSMIGLAAINIQQTNNDLNYDAKTISNMLTKYTTDNKKIRVTIIDINGDVLGDSDADFTKMSNHLYRDEIKQAISNTIGTSIRKSNTTGIEYMYIALFDDPLIIRLSYPLNDLKIVNNQIYLYTFIGTIIAFLLASILALRLSNNISKPISLLSEHSTEIKNGNFKHQISYNHKKDELKSLVDTFNDMTSELDIAFNHIRKNNKQLDSILNSVNDGIIAIDNNRKILFINKNIQQYPAFQETTINESVTHIKSSKIISLLENSILKQKSYHEELVINNVTFNANATYIPFVTGFGAIITLQDISKIKEAQNIRYEFVSNVTHELNTPLTSIQGFIETLKNGAYEDKAVTIKFLDIIDIEAMRLKVLINDILTLSNMENNEVIELDEHVNIYDIATHIIHLLSQKLSEKSIQIVNKIDKNMIAKINNNHANQLFINLIDNGIKYNNEHGTITLFTTCDHEYIHIHCSDSGIGIDEKHFDRLFERFYRVDKGRSRDMGGTGLGLSIVKHIALLYKGHVEVKSEVNKGSEFIISLPL